MDTIQHILNKFNPVINDSSIFLTGINRTIMAQTLGELGFKKGVEVGVAEGLHAEVLFNNVPDLFLYLVDAWTHYDGYQEYADLDSVYQQATVRLQSRPKNIYKDYSMNVVKHLEDNSIDFVYIDAAHDFKNVAQDVYEWTKKVKPGGIVFGHDYKHRAYPQGKRHAVHVKPVVDAYVEAFNINPFFVLTNDIPDPTFGRDNPGWMFVKP
jgi:predicted O-methyltransferase YrrM